MACSQGASISTGMSASNHGGGNHCEQYHTALKQGPQQSRVPAHNMRARTLQNRSPTKCLPRSKEGKRNCTA
eukprot:3693774-Alexandrium_andersonii.AAC.1